ncbi:MAG: PAS domain-containing protein [Desulfovibrio sp.]|nr:PAS domain-containing protein [Desulfovibrio sp.]
MTKTRRSITLILFFLALVVGALVTGAKWVLETSHSQMQHDTEQNLKTQATQRVAQLTVWYGGVTSQLKAFVDQDLLRLFASEVDSSGVPARSILDIARPKQSQVSSENLGENKETEESQKEAGLGKDEHPALSSLVERLPELLELLNIFVRKHSFYAACLVNRNFSPYLQAGELKIAEAWKSKLDLVLESGQAQVLPIRRDEEELVVDLAIPVFAPSYIDKRGRRVVSICLVTVGLQQVVSSLERLDKEGFFTSALLEPRESEVALIDFMVPSGQRILPVEWKPAKEGLSLGIRQGLGRDQRTAQVYSLVLPVPDLPWFVLQAVRVSLAEEAFQILRKNVYIGTGLLIALSFILTFALWWWFVGRRERAMADQLRKLYVIANEQKQILDGVNTSLAAGIILNDLDGKIYYVNQAYADMAHMDPLQMTGMAYTQLPYELAYSLVQHTIELSEKPALTNFTEVLTLAGSQRHFLTACSPCVNEQNCLVGMVSVYSDITELITAQEKAQRMVTQTVQVFVRAIEAIDPYLRGQSENVGLLSVQLAQILGFDDEETVDTLRTAASLSQIGMIQLPRSLLLKTGTLTAEERQCMQKHVNYARQALEGVDFGLPVLEAITQMYERLDGSGYPAGLKGEEICFNARLLAVANTFCALLRPRSYRTAHTIESALEIFAKQPSAYDPSVLAALRKYLSSSRGKLFVQNLTGRGAEENSNEAEAKAEPAAEAGLDKPLESTV